MFDIGSRRRTSLKSLSLSVNPERSRRVDTEVRKYLLAQSHGFWFWAFWLKEMRNGSQNKGVILSGLGLLFCLNILAWIAVWDLTNLRLLEINFFNVGQGDAIFITTSERQQILIDGGPDATILEKLGQEMPFWDRSIDLVVLTHPEHDHLAGLIEVLKRYEVKNILWTGAEKDNAENEEWLRRIKEERTDVRIAQSGQRIIMSKAVMEILYPFERLDSASSQENLLLEKENKEKIIKDTNNTSIVSQLRLGDNTFLFTGDIGKKVERQLVDQKAGIHSDVLKVSHHGSNTSSSEEFIAKVLPVLAVISVAKDNQYGHPHQEVLEILKKFAIRVLRTDQDGDIKIFSDGENFRLELKRD